MDLCHKLDVCFSGPARRWVAFVAALVELFWFSGVQYGFNALIPVFQEQGVFGYLCNGTDCSSQEKMYSYAFIVSVVIQMCLIPLAGLIMDKAGLRLNKLISVVLVCFGLFLFAFTTSHTAYLMFVAMAVISYASVSSLICNHHISSQFPNNRAIIIAMLNGAYDSSTAVFFIFYLTQPTIPIRTSFILLAIGTLVFGSLIALFLLTRYSKDMLRWTSVPADMDQYTVVQTNGEHVPDSMGDEDRLITLEMKTAQIIEARFPTLESCFCSAPFLFANMWFMLGLLRFSFFLSQLSSQLDYAFGGNRQTIDRLLQVSSAISMVGFLVSPISGSIMDVSRKYYSRKLRAELCDSRGKVQAEQFYWTHLRALAPATTLMASASTIMSCLLFVNQQQWVYYVAFICNMFLRSLLFSTTATMVISAFPVTKYGTVYGVVNLIGGVFSTLQYGLLELPMNVANGLCVAVSLLMFIPPLILFCKTR